MTKPIEDYTADELYAKINAIKAEHEKTANALKRYEEELERRKQEVPLGVPLKGTLNEMPLEVISRGFLEWFSSEASADKFSDYFYSFVEALQDIVEGKPIDIAVLLPLLKKGCVAMDYNKNWYWYECKPKHDSTVWTAEKPAFYLSAFNIKPADNWEDSLMECGL